MSPTSLSVVVFSRGNPEGCVRLLKSLERVDREDLMLEVILVYSGLNEKVQSLLKEHEFSFELKLITADKETNRAVGRNLGAKTARHEIILFMDSELESSPELLKRHMASYIESETIAVVGEQYLPPFVKKNRWFRFLDSDFRNIRRWAKNKARTSPPLRYVNTANFSIRRERYISCGGHGENISNRQAEDIDLAHRILANDSGRIIYDEEAIAFCQHPPIRTAMKARYRFGKEGIPKLLEAYPGIYGKLPSRFVRMEGFEPTGTVKRFFMTILFTKPFLVSARGLRLLGPEWIAFWMMRFMLQYYSVWGLKHALGQEKDIAQN